MDKVEIFPNLGSDMGEMGDLSSLVDGSIHISRDYRVLKGIEKDIVFLDILGVHEVALCSTVKED